MSDVRTAITPHEDIAYKRTGMVNVEQGVMREEGILLGSIETFEPHCIYYVHSMFLIYFYYY